MNVTEMAKHLGTSKPTLYKRVKDAGLELDVLRDKETGELTEQGYTAIAALFDNKTPVMTEGKRKPEPGFTDELSTARERLAALQAENQMLREMLTAKDAEIKRLEATSDGWRQMAERAQEAQLLLTATNSHQRHGIMDTIRGLFHKGAQE